METKKELSSGLLALGRSHLSRSMNIWIERAFQVKGSESASFDSSSVGSVAVVSLPLSTIVYSETDGDRTTEEGRKGQGAGRERPVAFGVCFNAKA